MESRSQSAFQSDPHQILEARALLHPNPRQIFVESGSEYHVPNNVQSLRNAILFSPFNLLLLASPPAIAAYVLRWEAAAIFGLNCLPIVPLTGLVALVTQELCLRFGVVIGSLLSATLGNAVQFILGLLILKGGFVRVVQAFLVGSILSNLLLTLGSSFLFGGLKYHEQPFNVRVARTSTSLLFFTILLLLIPAAFDATVPLDDRSKLEIILQLSRGIAVAMLVLFALYTVFQLWTHANLYEEEILDEEPPKTNLLVALLLSIFVLSLVVAHALFLVGSIEDLVNQYNLSQTFIGIILLPILTNMYTHIFSITLAVRDRMDLCLSMATSSSMQITLVIAPVLVLVGWISNKPMLLQFQSFETTVLFASALMVNYLIQEGKSNWLEGVMLVLAYAIVAVAFFFPEKLTGVFFG